MKICLLAMSAMLVLSSCARKSQVEKEIYESYAGLDSARLELDSDGKYSLTWRSDIGVLGRAFGNWQSKDGAVILSPENEEGERIKGRYRVLVSCELNGRPALIRYEEDRNNIYGYLFKKEKSNQSPEPTPPSGAAQN